MFIDVYNRINNKKISKLEKINKNTNNINNNNKLQLYSYIQKSTSYHLIRKKMIYLIK
jgi:hypothetical protein